MSDLIDDLLDAMRLRSAVFSRMTLCGDWGYAKDALAGAPFHIVLAGSVWIEDDEGNGRLLGAGDMAVLPQGHSHRILSAEGQAAQPWRAIVEAYGWVPWAPGNRFKTVDLRLGRGAPTATLISGIYDIADRRRNPLLLALPKMLFLSGQGPEHRSFDPSKMIASMEHEILSGTPGAGAICLRLADILFVELIRDHVLRSPGPTRGWLRGITCPALLPALAAIHRNPKRAWSMTSLAAEAGMSRSRFAARFVDLVGTSPITYLTRWRMYEASVLLSQGDLPLAAIAESVGYTSTVGFAKAFRRWSGVAPSEYRRCARADPLLDPKPSEQDLPGTIGMQI